MINFNESKTACEINNETNSSFSTFNKLTPNTKVQDLFCSLMDSNISRLPNGKEKDGFVNLLSKIYGIPVRNNVDLLRGLLEKKGINEYVKNFPLYDLLCMPRPNDDDPSLEPMRKYWRERGLFEDKFYQNSPLRELLLTTPYPDETSHAGLRRYTTVMLKEIARREVISGEECSRGLDKSHIKEFLKEIALLDGAVATKWGVQFLLGIVSHLLGGTDCHRDLFLKNSEKLDVAWCLNFTELGHGSNAQGMETTATLDMETGEFIIDSPNKSRENPTSLKWWPGGLGADANHSITFAKLIIDGKDYGLHAFAFRIRDEKGNNLKGVITGLMGPKIELNGIDNGWCYYDNMRVPANSFLNKHSDVQKKNGKWEYVIKNKKIKDSQQVYIHLMDEFIRGRQFIFYMSCVLHETAATIFDAFPPHGMHPQAHHAELCNFLADAYMIDLGSGVVEGSEKENPNLSKAARRNDHILASVMKATSTDMGQQCLQKMSTYYDNVHSRKLCEQSRRNDKKNRAPQIYEGENHMLYMLGASYILLKAMRKETEKWEDMAKGLTDTFKAELEKSKLESGGYNPEEPKTLDQLPFYERPLALLKREMLDRYYAIAENMMNALQEGKDPKGVFDVGPGPGAVEAVQASRMWGKVLIMEEALKKIEAIEKVDAGRAERMKALYIIFANNHCQGTPRKPYSIQDIQQARESLKGPTYTEYATHDLVTNFMRPIEWLDALNELPKFSVPYGMDVEFQRSRL
ncbi:MAG: hypothetical protein VX777_08520 [Chlamydiota bacterium]|nr:hypothetical protein [Chlamydiota bacterium]